MKRFLTKYKAWRAMREVRSLERWEKERARGKDRFVVRVGLYYGIAMVGMINAYERIFDGAVTDASILFKLVYYVPCGLLIGSFAWKERERDYQKALREGRAQAASLTSNSSQQQLPQGTPNT